jgi:hypothetical protein
MEFWNNLIDLLLAIILKILKKLDKCILLKKIFHFKMECLQILRKWEETKLKKSSKWKLIKCILKCKASNKDILITKN